MKLARKFYSTWYMPDNPARSCCNNADCYPTEIKYVGGNIYARRREDGQYILIPPQKVERNRDNPDGRNHLCAPPPNRYYPSDTVFCFCWEAAHEICIAERQHTARAISVHGTASRLRELPGELATRLSYCDYATENTMAAFRTVAAGERPRNRAA
jgi:hypothetical protein